MKIVEESSRKPLIARESNVIQGQLNYDKQKKRERKKFAKS